MSEERKTHIRELMESNFLGVWDLKGNEPTVTIDKVFKEKVYNPRTHQEESVTVIHFEKAKKDLILNATNRDRITQFYGPYVEDWHGKPVTLRSEQTKLKGEVVDAIRIKPKFEPKSLRS